MGSNSPILQAGAKRRDSYAIDPRHAIVMGVDKGYRLEDGIDPNDPCFDAERLPFWTDKEKLTELAMSMIAAGRVLEPVQPIVRKDGKGNPLVFIQYGHRRTLACRIAGDILEKQGQPRLMLPMMAPESGDEASLFGMVISENQFRVDDSPSSLAKKLQRFIRMRGDNLDNPSKDTLTEARRLFGVKDESTLRNWLKVGKLPEPVQELVDRGDLPQNLSREVLALPAEKQVEKANELVRRHKSGEKNLRNKARTEKKRETGKAAEDEHEGLTRGQQLRIYRLIQEDKAAGKEMQLSDDAYKLLAACCGKSGTERVKGLNGYLARIAPKSTDRAAE